MQMHAELVSFMETRKLSSEWANKSLFTAEQCDFNIVMTQKKRDKINAEWFRIRSDGKDVLKINNMHMELRKILRNSYKGRLDCAYTW